MCSLTLAVASEPSRLLKNVLQAQEEEFYNNQHGIGVLWIDKKNQKTIKRRLEVKDYGKLLNETHKKLPELKAVGIHTRTATEGVIAEMNVHFFGRQGVYFAHNGIAKKNWWTKWNTNKPQNNDRLVELDLALESGYRQGCKDCFALQEACFLHLIKEVKRNPGTYPILRKELSNTGTILTGNQITQQKSDSWEWFKTLKVPIEADDLLTKIETGGFSGKGVLYDSNQQLIYWFSTEDSHMITDKKRFVSFHSYLPTILTYKSENIFGLRVQLSKAMRGIKKLTLSAGSYVIDLNKPRIKIEEL